MKYVEMDDGFAHDGRTLDLLTIFKGEREDYGAINRILCISVPGGVSCCTEPATLSMVETYDTPRLPVPIVAERAYAGCVSRVAVTVLQLSAF
ncbi:hypothetical protein [Paraburkholderia fynbosensis]|uniref:hypothetical protein n=1 Tax=Paraburkholderia fynbosensis TaxID=1200993 RepID=UPI0015833F09|nr:hypothetical protein [Paraburkholderia fynbosensis]